MLYLVSGLHKTLPVKDYHLNRQLWVRGVSPYPAKVVKERPQKESILFRWALTLIPKYKGTVLKCIVQPSHQKRAI